MQNIKDEIFLKTLGGRIKAIRKAKKLTQADLAFRFNNHPEHVGRIERGEYNVSICTLKEIAAALEVSLSSFFDT